MSDLTLTAAKIAPVFPEKAQIFDMLSNVAVTLGQAVHQAATGVVAVSDATTSGDTDLFDGLVVGVQGKGVSVLTEGHVFGFDVSAVAVGTILYLSETAGALADAAPAGTGTAIKVGKVVALSDPTPTRVVYIRGFPV